jgi:hypothetical protein
VLPRVRYHGSASGLRGRRLRVGACQVCRSFADVAQLVEHFTRKRVARRTADAPQTLDSHHLQRFPVRRARCRPILCSRISPSFGTACSISAVWDAARRRRSGQPVAALRKCLSPTAVALPRGIPETSARAACGPLLRVASCGSGDPRFSASARSREQRLCVPRGVSSAVPIRPREQRATDASEAPRLLLPSVWGTR